MRRLTNSAATAVAPSRRSLVLAVAKYSSPPSSLTPWQEKCSSSRSSGRRSAKNSSTARLTSWAGSFSRVRTSKPPIWGSRSTPASAWASLATIRALRGPSIVRSPAFVAAQPLVGKPPLLVRGQPGQLQDVAVELELDAALRSAGKPCPNCGHNRGEQPGLGDGDGQRTKRGQLHRPGSRRGLACPWLLDRLDVEVEQLAAKLQGGLGDLLGVGVGPDGELDAERRRSPFHAHPSPPRPNPGACDTRS